MVNFWQRQDIFKPLFPNIIWNKPERKTCKIAIIGGNSNGFAVVALAYSIANKMPIQSAKIILPDTLKKQIPPTILDAIFAASNPSGSFSSEAIAEFNAAANYADAIIFIGDSGANAETASLFTKFIRENPSKNITLTRDAVDLISNSAEEILNNKNIHLVLSISQLQKISRKVYYPRVITLTQNAAQLAETLHKFTLTYPAKITVWHNEQIFFAQDGKVFSQNFDQPIRVWNGEIAVRETIWTIWNNEKDFKESVVSSWTEL